MSDAINQLNTWIDQIAEALVDNTHFEISHFSFLDHDVSLIDALLNRIEQQPIELGDDDQVYSACLFAFDICVIQLQAAIENHYQPAEISLNKIMAIMADKLNQTQHSINFWLPLLNAFYEVHIELSSELKDAYVDLASREEADMEDVDQLALIREMIADLSDLSVFDITQHFFAQSHAMPAEFYYDLLYDLFAIDEGHDIAILCLMHPKEAVREVVIDTVGQIIDRIELSPASLSRLQLMKHWYPTSLQPIFEQWIKIQRKQGVVFNSLQPDPKKLKILASEIDGNGAQVLYIRFQALDSYHVCSIMVQMDVGIKDIWFSSSPKESDWDAEDLSASDELVTRVVDKHYLQTMLRHFVAQSQRTGHLPDIRLLQLQEYLGLNLLPETIDIDAVLTELGAAIQPVTQEVIESSLQSSKKWPHNKAFTEAWYVQDAEIDVQVNQCCRFDQGVKICDKIMARDKVIEDVFENRRQRWLFHFVWHLLWLSANARKNERAWQDCFFIAYEIAEGRPLNDIPIMVAIAEETIRYSLETMQDRGTHLSRLR